MKDIGRFAFKTLLLSKTMVITTLCLLTITVKAQDVIISKESERIEAKIIEITETQISYIPKNKPNGDTYTIGLSRVASIIFENGDVFVPQEIPTCEQPVIEQNLNSTSTAWNDFEEEELSIALPSGQTAIFHPTVEINHHNGVWYYGTHEFKREGISNKSKDVEFFLKQKCPTAYHEYINWKKYDKTHVITLFLSVPAFGIGAYALANWIGFVDQVGQISFITLCSLGGVLSLSIPFASHSTKQIKNIQNTFNRECASAPQKQQASHLSFGVSPTGAGLSLSF